MCFKFCPKGGSVKNRVLLALLCLLLVVFPSVTFAAKAHKVKKNDTLYSLAKKYHVTVNDIKSANNLVSSRLRCGEVLIIPSKSSAKNRNAVTGRKNLAGDTYVVKKGDSLAKISKKTGVQISDLKRLNSIHKNRLKAGRVLVLKEPSSTEKPTKIALKEYLPKNDEFLNDNRYDQTLAELAEFDPEKKVDLNKSMQNTLDVSKRFNKTAFSFLGTRYRFGGTSRNGMDCSSFVQHVFRELDVDLPRTAREQYWVGEKVSPYDLQKGDLLFFRTYASFPSHVGIYLGDNKMIHASSREHKVVISPITSYYRSRFIGAKRMAKINPQLIKLEELFAGAEEEKEADVIKNDTLAVNDSAQNP
jgi:peptidoglycan endopeptidase LytE